MQRFIIEMGMGNDLHGGDQLGVVVPAAGLGDLDLIAGPLTAVVGGVGVGGVLHHLAAGLGPDLDDGLVLRDDALLVEGLQPAGGCPFLQPVI